MPLNPQDLKAIKDIIRSEVAPIKKQVTEIKAELVPIKRKLNEIEQKIEAIGNWIPYNSTLPPIAQKKKAPTSI